MLHLIFLLGLSAAQASDCVLSIHAVSAQGVVEETPLISPDQVLSIQESAAPATGEPLWIVRLDAAATQINSAYSRRHLGEHLAIFCGEREVSRPLIAGASGNEFAFTLTPSEP